MKTVIWNSNIYLFIDYRKIPKFLNDIENKKVFLKAQQTCNNQEDAAILIINFKPKCIIKDKENHFMMIKQIHQDNIFLNSYAPNNTVSKYIK